MIRVMCAVDVSMQIEVEGLLMFDMKLARLNAFLIQNVLTVFELDPKKLSPNLAAAVLRRLVPLLLTG
jgi:hypothetical protein